MRTRAKFHRFRGNTKCKATPLAEIRLRAAEDERCTPLHWVVVQQQQ